MNLGLTKRLIFLNDLFILINKIKSSRIKKIILLEMNNKSNKVKHILLFTAIIFLYGILSPLVWKKLVDEAIPDKNYDLIYIIALIYFISLVVSKLLSFLRNLNKFVFTESFTFGLSKKLYEYSLKNKDRIITPGRYYEYLDDVQQLSSFFTEDPLLWITNIVSIVFFSITILFFDPRVYLIVFAGLIIPVIIDFFISKESKRAYNISRILDSKEGDLTISQLNVREDILSTGQYKIHNNRWCKLNEKIINTGYKLNRRISKLAILSEFFYDAFEILLIIVGAYLATMDIISLGELISASIIAKVLMSPIRSLFRTLSNLKTIILVFDRVESFLSSPKNHDFKLLNEKQSPILSAHNISFKFKNGPMVFKDLSFNIEKGDKVKLTGPSGSGKSTLSRIISNLIVNYEGTIYKKNELKVVYQKHNSEFPNGALGEIISGQPQYREKEMTNILKICFCDEFLDFRYLNKSYDQFASTFSTGQKQRLSLARSLFCSPNLLILDEALSGIESEIKKNILQNLKREYKDMAIIYISHNNENFEDFDKEISLTRNLR